ncbi:SAM-dependent methyltransferase [Alsobacter sp. R-9]
MALGSLMAISRDLADSAHALAALGAAIRLRHENILPDPRIASMLDDIASELSPDGLEGLSPAEATIAEAWIRTLLRQAVDLMENPDRSPGWTFDDPVVLDSQGRSSRFAIDRIEAFAERRSSLADTLRSGGKFLDIGTGAGWIAIEATRRWAGFTATGLDRWEPALALARQNVFSEGVTRQVMIRDQALEEFREVGVYDLIWLPGPFFSGPIAATSLPVLREALVPGGTLVFGFLAPPPSGLAGRLATLQVLRSGGHPWSRGEVEALLVESGFIDVEIFEGEPLMLAAGRARGDRDWPK